MWLSEIYQHPMFLSFVVQTCAFLLQRFRVLVMWGRDSTQPPDLEDMTSRPGTRVTDDEDPTMSRHTENKSLLVMFVFITERHTVNRRDSIIICLSRCKSLFFLTFLFIPPSWLFIYVDSFVPSWTFLQRIWWFKLGSHFIVWYQRTSTGLKMRWGHPVYPQICLVLQGSYWQRLKS